MADVISKHANSPYYDTADAPIDDLTLRKYSQTKYGLMTPGRGRKQPGVIGFLDFEEEYNELTDSTRDRFDRQNARRETYHPPAPRFLSPHQSIRDFFRLFPGTTVTPFKRSNWGALDNVYTPLPDYAEADAHTVDPAELHDDQAGLAAFEDATQADVNPDAIDPKDTRLENLPAFIDAGENPDCLHKYDSRRNSDKMSCDHCGETRPWHVPLERGVRSLREGGIEEGRPDFDHVDPIVGDIKTDDETGCPRCNNKSISYRKGSEDYRCNTCKLEFNHPIPRQTDDDAERVCLFWLCQACEKPTRAPFAGIPTDLLDD